MKIVIRDYIFPQYKLDAKSNFSIQHSAWFDVDDRIKRCPEVQIRKFFKAVNKCDGFLLVLVQTKDNRYFEYYFSAKSTGVTAE